MLGQKTVQVSETQNFQNKIDELTGAAAASRALIEASIDDLKKNSAEMETQKQSITSLIEVLNAKAKALDVAISQNAIFIEKLTDVVNAKNA